MSVGKTLIKPTIHTPLKGLIMLTQFHEASRRLYNLFKVTQLPSMKAGFKPKSVISEGSLCSHPACLPPRERLVCQPVECAGAP